VAGGQASPGSARPGSPGPTGADRPTTTTAAPVTATESAEMWALIEQGLSGEETITCVVSGDDGAGRFYLASDRMFRFDLTGGSDIPSVVSTVVSTRGSNSGFEVAFEDLAGCVVAQASAGAFVEFGGDRFEVGLIGRDHSAPRQVLADQPVGVLVVRPLLRRPRMGEVNQQRRDN